MNYIARQIQTSQFFLDALATRFSEDELRERGKGNSVLWILGHIAYCRGFIIRSLGGTFEEKEWHEQVGMGVSGELDDSLTREKVHEALTATGASICALCEKLDEATLKEKADYLFGKEKLTKQHNLEFLIYHEGYHVGQLGLLAKQKGYDSLA